MFNITYKYCVFVYNIVHCGNCGIEPPSSGLQPDALPSKLSFHFERRVRFELTAFRVATIYLGPLGYLLLFCTKGRYRTYFIEFWRLHRCALEHSHVFCGGEGIRTLVVHSQYVERDTFQLHPQSIK